MWKWFVRLVCVMMPVLAGAQLFILKYQVIEKEEELKDIHQRILSDSREIYILEGDLALANDPYRLKNFVAVQGRLKPIKPNQIVHISDLPDKDKPNET